VAIQGHGHTVYESRLFHVVEAIWNARGESKKGSAICYASHDSATERAKTRYEEQGPGEPGRYKQKSLTMCGSCTIPII
jgi:hypothetical protein